MTTKRDPIATEWLGPNDQTPIPEEDFWEGETWEWVGKSLKFALPALALLVIGVGFFASKTYNDGADSYLINSAENRPAQIVSAEELDF